MSPQASAAMTQVAVGADRALDAAAEQPGSGVSIGATVWPVVTHQAAPRQTSRPPSVTMKDGIAR